MQKHQSDAGTQTSTLEITRGLLNLCSTLVSRCLGICCYFKIFLFQHYKRGLNLTEGENNYSIYFINLYFVLQLFILCGR